MFLTLLNFQRILKTQEKTDSCTLSTLQLIIFSIEKQPLWHYPIHLSSDLKKKQQQKNNFLISYLDLALEEKCKTQITSIPEWAIVLSGRILTGQSATKMLYDHSFILVS